MHMYMNTYAEDRLGAKSSRGARRAWAIVCTARVRQATGPREPQWATALARRAKLFIARAWRNYVEGTWLSTELSANMVVASLFCLSMLTLAVMIVSSKDY